MSSNYHHGDLAKGLIAAGLEALKDVGPDQLSLRELARRTGVSAAAPYRHFASRSELLEGLAAEGFRRAAQALGRIDQAGSVGVAKVWSEIASDNPGLFSLMAMTGAAGPDSDLGGAILDWLGEVTRALDPIGGDPELSVRRAVSCWSAIHGLVALSRGGALAAIDDWTLPEAADLGRAAAG